MSKIKLRKFTEADFTTPDPHVYGPAGTAKDKAKFANFFMQFVRDGCPETKWKANCKWFYNRLNGLFGFIAHYNAHGFFHEKFSTPEKRFQFIKDLNSDAHWGPWKDVMDALAKLVRDEGLVDSYRRDAEISRQLFETTRMVDLKPKYGDSR